MSARVEMTALFLRSTHLLSTLISFSNESSFPLRAFLSITLMANIVPGCSLLSARRTWEKAPLKQREREIDVRTTFVLRQSQIKFDIIKKSMSLLSLLLPLKHTPG